MATIYKVEMELVSEWVSYPAEDVKEKILNLIESHTGLKLSHDSLVVRKVR